MKEVILERHTSRVPRVQVSLTFLAFIMIGANDGAIGVLIPSIRTYYGMDKAGIGLLFVAGTAGFLIATTMSGLLAEKLGHRRFLLAGVTCYLGDLSVISPAPVLGLMLLGLLLIGLGAGVIDAGLNAYIAGLPNNSALLNYLHAFYGVGALVGPFVATLVLALRFGWNITYLAWAVVGVSLLAAFFMVFTDGTPAQHGGYADRGNVLVGALKL